MKGTVECIDAVHFYVDLARTKLGIVIPRPIIRFTLRGTTAGRAWAGKKNVIEFNPILLTENPERFVQQTVGHEVAHLIDFIRNPSGEPHGQTWRHVMWAFGLPAKRCHNYDVSTITGQRRISLAREVIE